MEKRPHYAHASPSKVFNSSQQYIAESMGYHYYHALIFGRNPAGIGARDQPSVDVMYEGSRAMHITHRCDHVTTCSSPTVLGEELGLSSSLEWEEQGVGPRILVYYDVVTIPPKP